MRRHRGAGTHPGRAAVFLDRDGTILDETGYLGDPGGVTFLDGAVEGMRLLHRAGYILLVVTNQSGIARGYFQEEDALAVNLRDRKSTRLNSSHIPLSRMPSSA